MGAEMSSGAENTDYLLDNADPRAERRFDALGHLFDAHTIEYLAGIGVTRGWSCWEVGAGGGTIAEWLAGAVAPTGSVLATDLDLRRLPATAMPGLTAAHHDVVHDDIPTGAYDLVHARLLLVHLPERERVLDSLVRSLRPGGWIVIEDFDNMFLDVGSAATPEQAVVRKVALAFKRLLQDRGADLAYARRLPDLLRARGLTGHRRRGSDRVRHWWLGSVATGGGELLPGCRRNDPTQSVHQRRAAIRSGTARGPRRRRRDAPADLRLGTPSELNHSARGEPARTLTAPSRTRSITPHRPGRRRLMPCKRGNRNRQLPSRYLMEH